MPYTGHAYDYQPHGGALQGAAALGLSAHAVIKTLVMQDEHARPLIVLMHGDREISTRNLARQLGKKHIEPAEANQAHKWTGYFVGGTSPFGCKTALPVYMERSIAALDKIYINGGKRGFQVIIRPQDLAVLNPQTVNVAVE